jgi:urease accessory protein
VTVHLPSVRVETDGSVAASAAGGYEWFVHRGRAPVAFLSTSLAALGEGEALDASVAVAARGSATVTTQGPTTLLRTGSSVAQRWTLSLEEGAHLTFLPWLTIPFPGARSQLSVDVHLGAGASLVAWDTLAVGRVARGERFRFDELRSDWRIEGPAGLQLHDRLAVRGDDRAEAATLMAGCTHLGSLYLAGLDEATLPVASVREALGADLAGASRLEPGLFVARALGHGSEELERMFWPVVRLARETLGLPALAPADVARRWFGGVS